MGKKIGYLGAGTWGFALSSLLASKGHEVTVWTRDPLFAAELQKNRSHTKLPGSLAPSSLQFTSDLHTACQGADLLVESITASGIRPIFERLGPLNIPILITSKGIEQKTGLLLPEVISQIQGTSKSPLVGLLSGPSHAEEVIQLLPTSVVCSAYDPSIMKLIHELFTTPTFRIYPNADIAGVAFGGAMKIG